MMITETISCDEIPIPITRDRFGNFGHGRSDVGGSPRESGAALSEIYGLAMHSEP
jgi:hypothetical protein